MSEDQVKAPHVELGAETVKYLSDLANESYKRQAELDESVWRSLPFFAATFAFVATIIGRSAGDVPILEWSIYSIVSTALLVTSIASLGWSLRWFWVVLKPREYEYPAPDEAIRQYAQDMADFHTASGVSPKDLDARTLRDMRLFMISQYGSAATTNLHHNAVKLKARPKVLLFMLLSFVLAFGCGATIFVGTHVGGPSIARGSSSDDKSSTSLGIRFSIVAQRSDTASPGTAEVTAGEGRGRVLGRQFATGNQEQTMTRGSGSNPPAKPNGTAPQRPVPPPLQVVMKDHAGNFSGSRSEPKSLDRQKD